jgi:hypothetical protein
MIRCKNIALLGLIATAFFTACEKPEPLYPQPKTSLGVQSQIFAMGENYANQLWFDFATQKTESNAFGLWHLGLPCTDAPRLSINGGIGPNFSVARYAGSSFGSITIDSLKKAKWHFDNPNGNADSSAFPNAFVNNAGKWTANNFTYVIDLGEKNKDSVRYVKLKINQFEAGKSYQISYGFLFDALPTHNPTIPINPNKNFVYYHFNSHSVVENEPMDWPNWDIVFTTYKETVPDANGVLYPYVIRGVLINPKKVSVAQLNNIPFDAVNLTTAQSVSFSKKQDEIGYDWKQYDQTAERYTMAPNRVYLIKTTDAIIKMKFVDFYNDQGVKGYPKMAWEILK